MDFLGLFSCFCSQFWYCLFSRRGHGTNYNLGRALSDFLIIWGFLSCGFKSLIWHHLKHSLSSFFMLISPLVALLKGGSLKIIWWSFHWYIFNDIPVMIVNSLNSPSTTFWKPLSYLFQNLLNWLLQLFINPIVVRYSSCLTSKSHCFQFKFIIFSV